MTCSTHKYYKGVELYLESDKEKNGILISEFGYIHKQIVTTSSTQINIII